MPFERRVLADLLGPIAGLIVAFSAGHAPAQDSRFVAYPWGKQSMIAGPACLAYPKAWESAWTPCDEETHEAWLADVRHWRDERRIRVGLNRSEEHTSELQSQ